MPDISIPLAMLRKPIEMVASTASGQIKEQISKLKAEKNLKKIYQKLNSTQKVKTIWNVERAITISSFYYPASIQTQEKATQRISCLDDLPSNAVILEGTAGQGKSILLRWLLGREIRNGSRLPLFIELRKLGDITLKEHIISSFSDLLDIPRSEAIFYEFARAGKISLLLDGYDEIPSESNQQITGSIESFAEKFPEARIVVTSRPKAGLENSPYFDVIPIAKLAKEDFDSFFEKILGKDKVLAKRLCTAINSSKFAIGSLVSTPLLATLLTIVYRAHQKIPTDFAEFYDELFQILLVRHDRSKPGYERKRKTNLSDREMQQVFEAFCYKTKAQRLTSIPKQKALEISAESIKTVGCVCNETHFLNDIKNVTCLLSEEGSQVDFLHQSVQEFFAARYIVTRPDNVANKFYTNCTNQKWDQWQQELMFLSRIDSYRASRDFFVPALQRLLTSYQDTEKSSNNKRLLVLRKIGVRQRITTNQETDQSTAKYFVSDDIGPNFYGGSVFNEKIFIALFTRATAIPWKTACFDGVTDGQLVTYEEIACKCDILTDALKAIDTAYTEISNTLDIYKLRISDQDKSIEFMDL